MMTDKQPEETIDEYIARKEKEQRERFLENLKKKVLDEVRKKLKPGTEEPEE